MPLRNSAREWGWPAKLLHWLVAVLIVGMIALGVVMVDAVEDLARKFALYQFHKSVGLAILALVLLRLAWRGLNPTPAAPPTSPGWEAAAARVTHAAFYVLLLAQPVTGFLMASAAPIGVPTVIFGVLPVPHPIGPDEATFETLKTVHETLARLLLALLVLHAAAALRHHFLQRDEVLLRMLPRAWRGTFERWRLRRTTAA